MIQTILADCIGKRMLVFGMGYDSEMWYQAAGAYFVESDPKYIELVKGKVPIDHIIFEEYRGITVYTSLGMPERMIDSFPVPEQLKQLAPFDVIYIDGPPGYLDEQPGRRLPIYWSKRYLSRPGTIIYIDDCRRKLEKFCIERYFSDADKTYYNDRHGCVRITI